MIAIIDYGAGNLGSVHKAFRFIGADAQITSDAAEVERADALVLPGVGAFSHCMSGLAGVGLTEPTKAFIASGRPFLGICVGLQMLFDESEEMGSTPGLGILRGKVVRFQFAGRGGGEQGSGGVGEQGRKGDAGTNHPITPKVPHIGWNAI